MMNEESDFGLKRPQVWVICLISVVLVIFTLFGMAYSMVRKIYILLERSIRFLGFFGRESKTDGDLAQPSQTVLPPGPATNGQEEVNLVTEEIVAISPKAEEELVEKPAVDSCHASSKGEGPVPTVSTHTMVSDASIENPETRSPSTRSSGGYNSGSRRCCCSRWQLGCEYCMGRYIQIIPFQNMTLLINNQAGSTGL